jgi:hypothetical protein
MPRNPTWWLEPFALAAGLTEDRKLRITLKRANEPDMEAQIEISPQIIMVLKMIAAAVDR